jgi:ribosome recycling factor
MTAEKRKRLVKMLNELDNVSFSNWEYEQRRFDLMQEIRAQLRDDTEDSKESTNKIQTIPETNHLPLSSCAEHTSHSRSV